ncbi:hypothetical protein SLEP1_g17591 [Rubroshorea leprosula]|uniref:Uncharacterized protein n=1 Tax=Rubroshorea leprosula TaxID=152421 RepID=A0AAV5J3V4_9ROSI|nr:hypothetical protein SLEP1_g17591 [Rubroshorea leprosula]
MSIMVGEWQQRGIKRSISDHCAIILKSRNADWGPKPVRVLDAWQQHPDFKKLVEEKWNEMKVMGYAGYRIANGRHAQNNITSILCNGRWVEEPEMVKNEVVQYFRDLFRSDSWRRPRLGGIQFKQISGEDKVWLKRPFSMEEIEALKNCDELKAPGPDGISPEWKLGIWYQMERMDYGMFVNCKSFDLVNGSPTEEFEAEDEGLLHGVEIGRRGMTVSLLQFADDTVFAGRANSENIGMGQPVFWVMELELCLLFIWECQLGRIRGIRRCGNQLLADFEVSLLPRRMLLCPLEAASFCLTWDFLWGGAELRRKISWVKWDLACYSKKEGGLGMHDLGRRSAKLRVMLVDGFRWEVGDGKRVGFWRENWVGHKPLRDVCPRIFALAVNKDGGVHLREGREDKWKWKHDGDGIYVVKKAYDFSNPTGRILDEQEWGVAEYFEGNG